MWHQRLICTAGWIQPEWGVWLGGNTAAGGLHRHRAVWLLELRVIPSAQPLLKIWRVCANVTHPGQAVQSMAPSRGKGKHTICSTCLDCLHTPKQIAKHASCKNVMSPCLQEISLWCLFRSKVKSHQRNKQERRRKSHKAVNVKVPICTGEWRLLDMVTSPPSLSSYITLFVAEERDHFTKETPEGSLVPACSVRCDLLATQDPLEQGG